MMRFHQLNKLERVPAGFVQRFEQQRPNVHCNMTAQTKRKMFRLSYFMVFVIGVVVVLLDYNNRHHVFASAAPNDAGHGYWTGDSDGEALWLEESEWIGSVVGPPVRGVSDKHDGRYINDNDDDEEYADENAPNEPGVPKNVDSLDNPAPPQAGHVNGAPYSFGDLLRPNYYERNLPLVGLYSFMELFCPLRPSALTFNWGKGARLSFHLPNQEVEVKIREVKGGIMGGQASRGARWRREDVDRVIGSGFDVKKPTMWYMGGWMQTDEEQWLHMVRQNYDALARKNNGTTAFNLIIFDWSAYNTVRYGPSVGWVPHIGEVVANFFEQIIDRHGYKADMVHLVSYSLSTHIAGVAGRLLASAGRGQVKQITAIDPTGLCIHGPKYRSWASRYALKPTDAKLVVARHYNMNEHGARELIGGVDIVVNGGKAQPRMHVTDANLKRIVGVAGLLPKHHHFAIQHESPPFDLHSDCHEIAYECPDLDSFERGYCADCGSRNESCYLISTLGNVELGITPADIPYKPNTQMHILTGVAQFCSYHYQVKAKLSGSNVSSSVVDAFTVGHFEFELSGTAMVRPANKLDNNKSGLVFTQLLRLDAKIDKFPKQIKVGSSSQAAKLLESVESVAINFMSHASAEQRAKGSFRYCPDKSSKHQLVECIK